VYLSEKRAAAPDGPATGDGSLPVRSTIGSEALDGPATGDGSLPVRSTIGSERKKAQKRVKTTKRHRYETKKIKYYRRRKRPDPASAGTVCVYGWNRIVLYQVQEFLW